jgi:hypothetical protein
VSHFGQMGALFVWLWILGGAPAAVLGEMAQAETPRIARAGRIAFAFLLAFDLLLAALVFVVGKDAPTAHMTRSLWWVTVIIAGVPLALVSGFAVRRGYTGHDRIALVAATLTTAVLYVAFPLGFIPEGHPLTGLGRFEHEHRALDAVVLLIPTLILLVDELFHKQEAAAVPEADEPSRSAMAGIPRRYLIATGAVLAILFWMAGTNGAGVVLGLGILTAASAVYLWQRNRSMLRSVRRDLRPPENP